jgi:hypothetical protein
VSVLPSGRRPNAHCQAGRLTSVCSCFASSLLCDSIHPSGPAEGGSEYPPATVRTENDATLHEWHMLGITALRAAMQSEK